MALIVSPNYHATSAGNLHILYNALALRPLRGNDSVLKLLGAFRQPQEPERLTQANPAAGKVLKTLIDNRLLVEPGADEREAWLRSVLPEGHRRPPRQAVFLVAGLGKADLQRGLTEIDGLIAGSDGPFSLVYKDLRSEQDWSALVGFLEWAGDEYARFDWLQHFVVTGGAALTTRVLESLRGYNLAFRIEGAADPAAVTAQVLGQSHRALVSVPLAESTTAAELGALGAKALYVQPAPALLRSMPTDKLVARVRELRQELKPREISVYGSWDHVVFGYAKRRLPRPLHADLTISAGGISVCGEKLAERSTAEVTAKGKQAPPPALPAGCAGCPVLGLCYGQCASPEGAVGDASPLCRLVVAEWREYLLTTSSAPTQAVAPSATFG